MTNMERFSTTTSEKNWNTVLHNDDAQNAYTAFYNEFIDVYNNCIPVKVFKRGYGTRKPWLSEGVKPSIKTKNKLYRRSKNTRNPEHELQYKLYRNKLNKLLFEAEKGHYEKLLNENRNNLRKSWRILKDGINKKEVTSSCSKFVVNGKTTTDKMKIANGFNQYFVNIGPTLASNIPQDNRSSTTYMESRDF